MSLIRVLTSAQVTLSHTFYVDEVPTDASGSVTVNVKRLDGTAVSSGTAVHPGAAGVYTYAVPAQAAPDALTVDWTGTVAGAAVTARDYVEVVGGFLFGLAEARAVPPVLDAVRYPTARLAAARTIVEQECERICQRAFVPRFRREEVPIRDGAALPREAYVRAIRGVRLGGTAYTGYTWASGGAITGLHTSSDTAVIEYEYGADYPPEDIRQAAMLRLRSIISQGDTGVPSRAVSFTVTDGGTYRLATPGATRTGVPDVDAVYEAYRIDVWGFV